MTGAALASSTTSGKSLPRRLPLLSASVKNSLKFLGVCVLAGLNVLDTVFTLLGIAHGATELNPVMRLLLAGGPFTFVAVKVGLGTWVIVMAGLRKEVRLLTVWVIVGVYGYVVIHNIHLLNLLIAKGSP